MLESFNPINDPSMRRLVPATLVGLALLMAGNAASALGLGRVSTLSYLGNPLEFNIAVSAVSSDALSPDCITADVFAGDSRVPPEMVRVRVNRSGDGTPTSLRVLTGTRIDEPVASVELTLDCGVRMTRKYVVFVDPPLLNMAQAESADPGVAAVATPPRRAVPSRDSAGAPSSRRTRSARSNDGTVQAGGTGAASAARQRRIARAEAARAARVAAGPAERGSRLKLESAAAVSAAAPVKERAVAAATSPANVATALPGAASAARPGVAVAAVAAVGASAAAGSASAVGGIVGELAAKAEADALALNAERLKALEERMTRLLNDNKVMQRSVQDLQAQLAEAEAKRYANPLVYGLAAAVVLMLLAVIALLWRQAGMRKESEWLKAAAADSGFAGEGRAEPKAAAVRSVVTPSAARAAPAAGAAAAATALAAGAATTPSGAQFPRLVGEETSPSATLLAGRAQAADGVEALPPAVAVVGDSPAPALSAPGPNESTSRFDARREVTVEELIDLEQQADFFVVLGQDDAAIDLLMGHVQGTGGASPLPYLKLLEIHRRRDEREAYDRVRDRFNRRFGAFAPEWDAHTGHDRALEDYPSVVTQLQDLWAEPTKAMEALSGLLFQRDPSTQTFDLPAYGELLFLYSLARERAEHEPPTDDGVDLLLPLDDGPAPAPSATSATSATPGRPGALGLAAAVGAAGAAGAAFSAVDDPLSLAALPDLPAAPSELPPTYPAPLASERSSKPDSGLDDLLDLNISEDPAEPKGPLSKW